MRWTDRGAGALRPDQIRQYFLSELSGGIRDLRGSRAQLRRNQDQKPRRRGDSFGVSDCRNSIPSVSPAVRAMAADCPRGRRRQFTIADGASIG